MDVPRPRVRTRMSARAVRHSRPGRCGPSGATRPVGGALKNPRVGRAAHRATLRKVAHHRTPAAATWRPRAAVVSSRGIGVAGLELLNRLDVPAPGRALD